MNITSTMCFQLWRKASLIGDLPTLSLLFFLDESRGLMHLFADDEAGDQHHGAHQERNAPAPLVEGFAGHEVGQRQEHRRRHHLAGLHALQKLA
jgi:hypothetical protein